MKYILQIRCEIRQTDDMGAWCGNGLTVQENLCIDAGTFMEVAAILAQFHELAQKVKS